MVGMVGSGHVEESLVEVPRVGLNGFSPFSVCCAGEKVGREVAAPPYVWSNKGSVSDVRPRQSRLERQDVELKGPRFENAAV